MEIPTHAYVMVSPNPVGVNQQVFIVMWLHGAPPTAAGVGGDRWHDFYITIIKPDGSTEKLGPFISDPTGSAYTIWTPDQVGTYTIVFNYTGQVLSLYHPKTGIRGQDSPFVNDTFLPSSAVTYLTVQEEPIPEPPTYPLPSEYWTRPIEGQNTAWASIASHWLQGAHVGYRYGGPVNLWQKDGIAPNTPHIMWTMPIEFGGVVGGTTEIPGVTFYSGGSYEGRFTYAIVMAGRLYFVKPLNHAGGSRASGSEFVCVDLRTGEVVWSSEEIAIPLTGVYPSSLRPVIKGQLYDYESMNQHGVVGGIIWVEYGSTWVGYDAWTGKWIFNFTNVPSGFEVYMPNGEIRRYVLNYDGRWLACWTTAALPDSPLVGRPGTGSYAYQYRPIGKNADMSKNYLWNVSIPDLPGLGSPEIVYVIPGDIILGTSAKWPRMGGVFTLQESPITMWALSDKPETRGQLLWIRNYSKPFAKTWLLGPVDEVNRVFTMTEVETMSWMGFSLDTGEQLWGPVSYVENAFSYYGSGEGAGQKGFCAYGILYTQGFGGELCAISTKNGSLLWKYSRSCGLNAPWGNYPIFIAAIADGKVYAFNNEHSPNAPYYKDYRIHCLDAFTGEVLWTLMGWAGQTGGRGISTSVLAEGFLVYYNYYDNQIYCIGKGPSAIKASVSPKVVSNGESVLIEGVVTDISPGTQQDALLKRFPNGVPAVADESMDVWMEYLYMQKPKPQEVKGVLVELYAIKEDGTSVKIGEAVTDPLNGGIFKYLWTPPDEGTYIITAVFPGSESYWGSYASVAVGVVAAEGAAAPTLPTAEILIAAVAVVGAIAIADLIINIYTLRKQHK